MPPEHGHEHDHPAWCTCSSAEEDRRRIEEHGWLVVTVPAEDEEPWDFHYTAGLTAKDLPELVVYGLPAEVAGAVLNDLASALVGGATIVDGQPLVELLEGPFHPQLRTAVRRRAPLGVAEEQYGDQVRVRQLVLPDRENRMPWDPDFDESFSQPVLYAWAPVPPPGR